MRIFLLLSGLSTLALAAPARADESLVASEQAARAAEPAPSATPRRNLAFDADLMVLPKHRATSAQVFGVNGALSFALGSGFSLGPSLGLLRADVKGETPPQTMTILRPGARLAWGSADEDGIFGVALDLGTWAGFGGYKAVTFLPYLQPSVVMQWPKGTTRPYLAVNAMLGFAEPGELAKNASEAFGPFGVGVAMGFSWSAL